jgi:hypothetical protein
MSWYSQTQLLSYNETVRSSQNIIQITATLNKGTPNGSGSMGLLILGSAHNKCPSCRFMNLEIKLQATNKTLFQEIQTYKD